MNLNRVSNDKKKLEQIVKEAFSKNVPNHVFSQQYQEKKQHLVESMQVSDYENEKGDNNVH